jgi:hypothetical protein
MGEYDRVREGGGGGGEIQVVAGHRMAEEHHEATCVVDICAMVFSRTKAHDDNANRDGEENKSRVAAACVVGVVIAGRFHRDSQDVKKRHGHASQSLPVLLDCCAMMLVRSPGQSSRLA